MFVCLAVIKLSFLLNLLQQVNNQFLDKKCNCARKTAGFVGQTGGSSNEGYGQAGVHFNQDAAGLRYPQQFPATRFDILRPESSGVQGIFGGDPTGTWSPLSPPPIRPDYFDSAGGTNQQSGTSRRF